MSKGKINISEITLFENSDLFVLNKPPGLSCLEDRSGKESLLSILKERSPEIQLCHRLDKNTSGTLIASKNKKTYSHIASQFEAREVYKLYHAVVHGRFPDEEITIEEKLEISGKGKARVSPKGKDAETLVSLLKGFRHYSVLNCMPLTGRFHQIRAHLSHLGFPIAGDELYGGSIPYLSQIKTKYRSGKAKDEAPMIDRFCLHAIMIKFYSPDGKFLEIEAPYPPDLLVFQKVLKKYDSR